MPPRREDSDLLAEFGLRVTHYRRQRGLTQSQLGKYCQLTRASIANIELGRQNCSVIALISMAAALGILPAALLGGHPGTAKPEWADQVRREARQHMTTALERFLATYTHPEEGP